MQGRFGVAAGKRAPLFNIPLRCIRVFSRLAMIFVLLAQGLERGSYEPDVTGSIPVWDMAQSGASERKKKTYGTWPKAARAHAAALFSSALPVWDMATRMQCRRLFSSGVPDSPYGTWRKATRTHAAAFFVGPLQPLSRASPCGGVGCGPEPRTPKPEPPPQRAATCRGGGRGARVRETPV